MYTIMAHSCFYTKMFFGENLSIVFGILEGVSIGAVFVKFAVLVLGKYEK